MIIAAAGGPTMASILLCPIIYVRRQINDEALKAFTALVMADYNTRDTEGPSIPTIGTRLWSERP